PVPPMPDPGAPRLRWQPLAIQVLRMHPHDEYLLIMRAVEDPDLTPRRSLPGVAPEVVVTELSGRRHLEAVHRDTLRVDAAHHIPDRPVLAARVQRLEDHQYPVLLLRGKPLLVFGEQLDPVPQQLLAVLLAQEPGLITGVEIAHIHR